MFLRICALGVSAFLAYDLVRFPLIPRLAYQLGAGPQLIGLAVSASTITGIGVKWLAGGFSDHWGRRRLLFVGCVLCAIMPLTYLFVTHYRALILLRFAHGLVTAIIGPVARAVVSDLAERHERGAKLGTYSAAVQVGMSAGRWLGGLLLFWGGFRFPLIAASLAGGVALWLVATWPAAADTSPRAPWSEVVRAVVDEVRLITRSRLMMAAGIVEASQFVVRGALEAFLPIYAVTLAHLNDGHVGMLFGLQLLTLVVAKPLTGWWSDRIGRVPLMGLGLLICASLVWLIPRTVALWGLSALLVGYSLGMAAASAACLALITDLTPAAPAGGINRYGASHGFFGTLVDIGHASGPILGGLLIGWCGYQATFLALAVFLVVVAVGFLLVARAPRPVAL